MNYLVLGRGANTGDLGIASAMLQDIRAGDPDASFTYLCDRPDAYAALPELKGQTVGLFAKLISGRSTRALARLSPTLEFLVRFTLLRWLPFLLFRLEPELRQIAHQHAEADVVVRQGGPGWNDWVLRRKVIQIRLCYYALARHYGVPVVKFGQSFGPFEWRGWRGGLKRAVVRYILNRTDILAVRDGYSKDALLRIGVSESRIVEAADVAWNLSPAPASAARQIYRRFGIAGEPRPWIGLTLRSMHGRYGVPEEREQQLAAEFAAFCDHIIEHVGTLVFLSTDYRQHGRRNDLQMLALVQQRMRNPSAVRVIDEELPAALIKAMYAEMDALVTVRLHPGIFAMAEGVPTLLIGYDRKCTDVAERVNGKAWYLDIESFTADAGVAKMEAMVSRLTEVGEATTRSAEEMKRLARCSAHSLEALRKRT